MNTITKIEPKVTALLFQSAICNYALICDVYWLSWQVPFCVVKWEELFWACKVPEVKLLFIFCRDFHLDLCASGCIISTNNKQLYFKKKKQPAYLCWYVHLRIEVNYTHNSEFVEHENESKSLQKEDCVKKNKNKQKNPHSGSCLSNFVAAKKTIPCLMLHL